MNVLVACESEGHVRDEFLALGHNAWSCDLLPSASPGPHFQCDILRSEHLDPGQEWDLMIAFPPCTHLAVSGARWFAGKQAEQAAALEFVRVLMAAPIPRICIENPVSIISSRIRKPDQTIQPYQFWDGEPGKGEVKRTCLWLKNLPKLIPTTPDEPGRVARIWRMGPSPTRSRERSVTYQGIANAMAEQWGSTLAARATAEPGRTLSPKDSGTEGGGSDAE